MLQLVYFIIWENGQLPYLTSMIYRHVKIERLKFKIEHLKFIRNF